MWQLYAQHQVWGRYSHTANQQELLIQWHTLWCYLQCRCKYSFRQIVYTDLFFNLLKRKINLDIQNACVVFEFRKKKLNYWVKTQSFKLLSLLWVLLACFRNKHNKEVVCLLIYKKQGMWENKEMPDFFPWGKKPTTTKTHNKTRVEEWKLF